MNVLIIVFSLIFLTPNSMLNNDQAKVIQETYQSYQALVAHCKQHNLDINTILSPAQKKQLKGGMEFLKTWMPEVKKVMKAMDIPEPTFIDAVTKWRDDFIKSLKETAKEYSNVKLLGSELTNNILLSSGTFKISKEVVVPLLEKIINDAAGQEELMVDNFCTSIITALNNDLSDTKVAKHYDDHKKGKKGYKKDSSTKTEVVDALPSIREFIAAVVKSIDPNDPSHSGASDEGGISKTSYVRKIRKWLNQTAVDFRTYTDDHKIKSSTIIARLQKDGTQRDPFVSKRVYPKFEIVLKQLEEESTSANVIALKLAKSVEGFNDAEIAAQYQIATYTKFEDNDFIGTQVPDTSTVLYFLFPETNENSLDGEDGAAAYATFKQEFTAAMLEEKKKLEAITTNGDAKQLELRIINIDKLKKNKGFVVCPNYAKFMTEGIQKAIEIIVTGSSTMTTANTIKTRVRELIVEYQQEKNIKALFEAAQKANNTSAFPSGFAGWINASCDKADFSSFESVFKDNWATKVENTVDAFELGRKQNNQRAFKLDRNSLVDNFKQLFSQPLGINAAQLGLDVHSEFEKVLSKEKVLDASTVNTAWRAALNTVKQKSFMLELCKKHITTGIKSIADKEQAIAQVDSVLPNQEALIVALYNSRYYSKPIPTPKGTNGEMLQGQFKLHKKERPDQQIDVLVDIPLRFIPHKLESGKTYFQVCPKLPSEVKYTNMPDMNGYEIIKAKKAFVGKTTFVDSIGAANTSFTVVLEVKDTSEQTVIQEAKLGELNMVSLSLGQKEEVLKKLKEGGAKVDSNKAFGLDVKLVGNDSGHVGKIQTTITILGLPFVIAIGEDGFVGYFKNPLAVQDAVLQYKYGAKTFDLYLTCNVASQLNSHGGTTVKCDNGQLGNEKGGFQPKDIALDELVSKVIMLKDVPKAE